MTERLKEWIKTLNEQQKEKVIITLTKYAICGEYVKFPSDTKVPYFDEGGNVDGTESEYED